LVIVNMIDTSHLTATARLFSCVFAAAAGALIAFCLLLAVQGLFAPHKLDGLLSAFVGFEFEVGSAAQARLLLAQFFCLVAAVTATLEVARRICAAVICEDYDRAARSARWLPVWCLALFVLAFIGPVLTSVTATWSYPQGERVAALSLGLGQIGVGIALLIATFLARLLQVGAELWRDHREVI
jgi:hypothetical protein